MHTDAGWDARIYQVSNQTMGHHKRQQNEPRKGPHFQILSSVNGRFRDELNYHNYCLFDKSPK